MFFSPQSKNLIRNNDSRRGPLAYRYDPVGRLLSAVTRQGVETFAFDPAGNLLDDKAAEIRRQLDLTPPRSKLVDNLLHEYASTHYDCDERGNQILRWHNGQRSDMRWDLFDRLVHSEDPRLSVDFAYDALGRRLHKKSRARYKQRPEAGSLWTETNTPANSANWAAVLRFTVGMATILRGKAVWRRAMASRDARCITSLNGALLSLLHRLYGMRRSI